MFYGFLKEDLFTGNVKLTLAHEDGNCGTLSLMSFSFSTFNELTGSCYRPPLEPHVIPITLGSPIRWTCSNLLIWESLPQLQGFLVYVVDKPKTSRYSKSFFKFFQLCFLAFGTAVWFWHTWGALVIIFIKFIFFGNEMLILEMLFQIKTRAASIWNCGICVMTWKVKMECFFQKKVKFLHQDFAGWGCNQEPSSTYEIIVNWHILENDIKNCKNFGSYRL